MPPARLAREEGVALTVAMATVAVIGIASALLAGLAGELADSSNAGRDAKRAFAAADGGLDTARYRLNLQRHRNVPNLHDASKLELHVSCFGADFTAAIDGACPPPADPSMASTGSVGTRTRYAYQVTPVLTAPNCDAAFQTTVSGLLAQADALIDNAIAGLVGLPGEADPLLLHRCATSTGETLAPDGQVAGVARVQEGLAMPFALLANLVADDGTEGTDDLIVDNATVSRPAGALLSASAGIAGTNGTVRIRNNGRVDTDVAHPAPSAEAVVTETGGTFTGQLVERGDPWRLVPVSVGDSRTDNDNGVLLCGLTCTYDPARRELQISSLLGVTGTATLNPGIHNYCRIVIDGGLAGLTVDMAGARVFLDPTGCPADMPDAGSISVTNAEVIALGADRYTGLYVHGSPPGGGPGVRVSGGLAFKAAVYAPEAAVDVSGAPAQGGIYARRITLRDGASFLGLLTDVRVNLLGAVENAWMPTGWRQCATKPAGVLAGAGTCG